MSHSKPLFPFYTGCAGWTIAKEHSQFFPSTGTHLERYARLFSMVEINVTFYRLPRADTFVKWASAVPEDFRFAVKMPRSITHYSRFKDTSLLDEFLDHIVLLGNKLGPVLIQLPPGFAFEAARVSGFFNYLRKVYAGQLVCEARHVSWFVPEVEQLLYDFKIARVAANPSVHSTAAHPGGWKGLAYFRLHGSPKMYYSTYPVSYLKELAAQISELRINMETWCVFDNTAAGEAVANAIKTKELAEQV